MAMGLLLGGVFVTVFALWMALAALGAHGLMLGRMPGRRLKHCIHRPRLWGTGALTLVVTWNCSPSICVIGLGLVAIGHLAPH